MKQTLLNKIDSKQANIGVIGLGYVGLPLAVLFSKKGFRVTGFDVSEKKVGMLSAGTNYIGDVDDGELRDVIKNKNLIPTTDFSILGGCDAIIICVPTPLDQFKKPDMSYIEDACRRIGKHIKRGTFVSLESTTYPTTTELVMLPIIEQTSGLKHGTDFWICFSPERVDPGNKKYKTENTPKVVGGLGTDATNIGIALYSGVILEVHPVSSPKVAEMVKILENTYRLVNISMINELALLSGKMGIDIWEVIEAAKTKPFGFQPFYPGPGIGGHCIPLDPFYLEYIAKNYQFDLSMIHSAGHIDMMMPHRMTIKINSALNRHQKPISGSRILFLGVAYKPDIDDERESPALKIMDEIAKKNGLVHYHDPYIASVVTHEGRRFSSVALTDDLITRMDCVVISTNHSSFDIPSIVEKASLVVDLQNATKGLEDREKIYKL